MGKVPDLKRVTAEDFPKDDQALVKKLGFIINSFHEQVRSVLNRSVDFQNLNQEVKTLQFATNSQGQPLNQISFRSDMSSRVQGMIVVRATITTDNTQFVQTLPIISWSQAASLVTITNIGGLLPETGYELSILTL